ncbi:RidA family protein [Paenibacillus sp. SAF-054]|uniref:RidA family protein n=1 Tax=unclassified Paenibacillus TaxID=185978 RepID=UPI003F7F4544
MTLGNTESRLESLGIVLPESSTPAGKYVNCVMINGLMFVSGKGPSGHPSGKLGSDYSTEEGYRFARSTGIEILAAVKSELGSLDLVKRVVKLQGFVNAQPFFEEHHKVLNGCSDLMIEVFGERGSHARSVFGAVSVRDNLPIIIDSIFEVEA